MQRGIAKQREGIDPDPSLAALVVGDSFGLVHVLSREDGSLLTRLTTDGSAIAAAPVLAGNAVVVVTRNGGIFGFVPQ